MKPTNTLILQDLKNLLQSKFPNNVKEIILFGSQAHGISHNDSDYDILIIMKNTVDWKTEHEISDICYEIDLKYDIITDTHILSVPELSTLRGKQPIFVNAITNGIHA
jgi:uncharacterized protein